jgi:glycosyltransferase involved in cell wall biosynthesis
MPARKADALLTLKLSSSQPRIKVGFLIATQGHGRGGHFWDLKTIVEALRERVECVVINIGPCNSPVVDSIPVKIYNIRFAGLNIPGAVRQVVDIIKGEQIDVLDVFDMRIFCIADIASWISKKGLVITKCGGPNPGKLYPTVDYMVVFSKENMDYFLDNPEFANTQIRFLPNRVAKITSDRVRIEKLRERLNPGRTTFLIIARFCRHYMRNMMQGADLIRLLNAEGRHAQLMIIGTPEDPDVVKEIASYSDDSVVIVNDEEFTLNASKLIDIADMVIAAGRGFMEAASCGKPLLTSVANSPFPLLITKDVFPDVFATNFSPRNRIDSLDVEENYARIARAVEEDSYRVALSDLSLRLFFEHFDVNSVVDEYQAFFSIMQYKRRFHPLTLLHGTYTTVRSFIPTLWQPFRRQE